MRVDRGHLFEHVGELGALLLRLEQLVEALPSKELLGLELSRLGIRSLRLSLPSKMQERKTFENETASATARTHDSCGRQTRGSRH